MNLKQILQFAWASINKIITNVEETRDSKFWWNHKHSFKDSIFRGKIAIFCRMQYVWKYIQSRYTSLHLWSSNPFTCLHDSVNWCFEWKLERIKSSPCAWIEIRQRWANERLQVNKCFEFGKLKAPIARLTISRSSNHCQSKIIGAQFIVIWVLARVVISRFIFSSTALAEASEEQIHCFCSFY